MSEQILDTCLNTFQIRNSDQTLMLRVHNIMYVHTTDNKLLRSVRSILIKQRVYYKVSQLMYVFLTKFLDPLHSL